MSGAYTTGGGTLIARNARVLSAHVPGFPRAQFKVQGGRTTKQTGAPLGVVEPGPTGSTWSPVVPG